MKKHLINIFILLFLVSCSTTTVQKMESEGIVYNHKTFITAIKYDRIDTVKDFIESGMIIKKDDIIYAKNPGMVRLLIKNMEEQKDDI